MYLTVEIKKGVKKLKKEYKMYDSIASNII